MSEDFESWISRKLSRKKKKGTYRERVLAGEQSSWQRKKRIKSVSKKRNESLKKYYKACSEYLKEHPACEICGRTENLSVHHKKGREGDLLFNKEFFMTLCLIGYSLEKSMNQKEVKHSGSGTGGCHGFIHANPNLARKYKWIL